MTINVKVFDTIIEAFMIKYLLSIVILFNKQSAVGRNVRYDVYRITMCKDRHVAGWHTFSLTMRPLLTIYFLFISVTAFSQRDEIYKLAFSDTSNFRITTYLHHKRPARLFIIDTTNQWRTERFWIKDLDGKSAGAIRQIEGDEHHPYNHTYLFKDSALNHQISDSEKKFLSEKAGTLKSKKIALSGKRYLTVPSSGNIKGFYFVATEPVFTIDTEYAFIDLLVFYKDKIKQALNETYFGTVCIVYRRQSGNKWVKVALKNHLIL